MTTWVALLRGINVGGGNRLPMRDLVALLEGLGLEDVRTYIQSGNVVFRATRPNTPELAAAIREAIRAAFGFAPRVMLLEAEALLQAAAANPYPEAERAPTTLHLFFLDAEPIAPDLDGLRAVAADGERFAIRGSVFYLHAPAGIGRSKLAERAERLLGVPATARNWNTVVRLTELVG